jgi:hypothetical protein
MLTYRAFNLPSQVGSALGVKNKNATDSTDSTDLKSLADDTFELERPGAEVQEARPPESRGGTREKLHRTSGPGT